MSTEAAFDHHAVWGFHAGIGPGYTLEAAAVRLVLDIGELRADGGLPEYVRTVVTVLPQQHLLEIQVTGLSLDSDPDRATTRTVLTALFELASYHNVVALDGSAAPLFTQHIVALDPHGEPFAALVGAAIGDVQAMSRMYSPSQIRPAGPPPRTLPGESAT